MEILFLKLAATIFVPGLRTPYLLTECKNQPFLTIQKIQIWNLDDLLLVFLHARTPTQTCAFFTLDL